MISMLLTFFVIFFILYLFGLKSAECACLITLLLKILPFLFMAAVILIILLID